MTKISAKFQAEYQKLNAKQKEAVDTIDGPVLVVAGPGSGKTQVLSMRAGNILLKTDARPGNILCLTFTDAAAVNMKRRLSSLIGKDGYRVNINTFHSFCVDIIKRYPEYFYGGASFYPADDLVSLEVLEKILDELSYDNPLSKSRALEGYIYLSDIKKKIETLKKAGLTALEFENILKANDEELAKWNPEIARVFSERISKASLPVVKELASKMESSKTGSLTLHFLPLSTALSNSLKEAVAHAEEEGKATPLSDWKRLHTRRNADKELVLKETLGSKKLYALADVYKKYSEKMFELGYYDFDDMLLDVIQAIQKFPELQYELWEQYQYILVDEFQDTNDAQMRLLSLLTDADVTEGRPNIFAVGDDDQSIYKFQGALLSNILDFRKRYRDPKMIVLSENYRSTQEILDLARFLIKKGEERLENFVPEIKKDLVASNKKLGRGNIFAKSFHTDLDQYSWVAKEIQRLIDEGKDPKEIAILSRKHRELETFSRYLDALSIPIYYERKQNVFDEAHVHQLVTMARFTDSLLGKNKDEADELLPEILSYPFWGLSRKVVWEIATRAEREKTSRERWMDIMLSHKDPKIRNIANFFLYVSNFSKHHTLLETLDLLIGEHVTFEARASDVEKKEKKFKKEIKSPFKAYYFNQKNFEENKLAYLTFLSALQVFVSAIREYKKGETLTLSDLVTFVDRHKNFHIPVTDESPFVGSENAVSLLSVHKAKGLEFGTVFILSCQEDIWAKGNSASKLPFPTNLPLDPEGENTNDHLRLFFVAVTRAKEELYMTSFEKRSDGKNSLLLSFLSENEEQNDDQQSVPSVLRNFEKPENTETRLALVDLWKASHTGPYIPDEDAMLRKMLENYQMSVTHLNNYLDVPRGGPKYFLEQSLLHFPQAKGVYMSYGTAMHKAIEELYKYLRFEGKLPSKEEFLKKFESALLKERMLKKDFQKFFDQGKNALSKLYEQKKDEFDAKHFIERDFKDQGVFLGQAHLSGKIDKMIKTNADITVVDYKTGKPALSWNGKDKEEKHKLYRYKNQLLFYKILVEGSRDFGESHKVKAGKLEFLEPDDNGHFIELPLELVTEETEKLKKLIEIVYEKIKNLDFPDTSHYDQDFKGVLAFEQDLLDKKI